MLAELTKEDLVAKWEDFFVEYEYRGRIVRISELYPDERSLAVSFTELDRFDADLALQLFESPRNVLEAGEEAIKSLLPPGIEAQVHLRMTEVPKDARIEVRRLRSKNLGKFVSIEGLVKMSTDVRPKVLVAVFKCARCETSISVWQEGTMLMEPLECLKEGEGGCGRPASQTRFKLSMEDSRFVDTQKIEIQEKPERLKGGEMPQRLVAFLEDDLTGLVWPGARIVINGTLMSMPWRKVTGSGTLFDIFLDVNSIDKEKEEYEEVEVSPENIEEFKKLAADKDIFRKLINSICPTMYGLVSEKETLALQLFGGVPKKMKDGTKIRGDIHMLLVGDPGTGKSQILSYMSALAPRGIYTSGKASTAAGLTAAAVKETIGEGRWTLEAGTVVLADKGLACIDELDKNTTNLLTAMELPAVSAYTRMMKESLIR